MRKFLMPTFRHQLRDFSDFTIRRFLLAQLFAHEQSAFEAALFTNSRLAPRLRLSEIELIDDYAADRLRANERAAFQQKFLVTAAREKQLEVSAALQRSRAGRFVPQPAASRPNLFFPWPQLAWRLAFAIVVLMVLFASALVIRREPQIVRRIIPKRLRPAAVTTPTPETAHHATSSSESRVHRDQPPPVPDHEASPQTIILRANSSTDDAPIVRLANNASQAVRIELMLERFETATFSVVVTTTKGEIVHHVPEMRVQASDRIDFDVQIERLKPGDFHITRTRLGDRHATPAVYYFRVQ